MIYKILADTVVITHLIWIIFMIVGFVMTFYSLAVKNKKFFDRWLFRTIHFLGILYVSVLSLLGKYCPLTVWENNLRIKYDPGLVYPGSCMVHYIQKLVYPNIDPQIINLATIFIAVFTLAVFILKPPAKIKNLFLSRTWIGLRNSKK